MPVRGQLNTRMLTTISLDDCLDLIDLMMLGDHCGPSFKLCGIERFDDPHGWFGAAGPDWEFMMVLPGWYAGELGPLILMSIEGDALTCLQWLPIDREDKRNIIDRLSLHAEEAALCRLEV